MACGDLFKTMGEITEDVIMEEEKKKCTIL